jgi:hypothetical protein
VRVRRTIAWFSCGAASAIAVKLTGAQPVYCETGAEHPRTFRCYAHQWLLHFRGTAPPLCLTISDLSEDGPALLLTVGSAACPA